MSDKSIFNKLKSKISGKKFRFIRRYNWIKSFGTRRYIKPLYYIKKLILSIVSFSFILAFFLFFLYKINILTISSDIILNNITHFKVENFEVTGLLSTQISMSLILVSLVSLVSSLDEKYIYGEKAIEQVFRGQGAFKIKTLYLLLLILPILNILVLINNYGDTYFIVNFLITLSMVIYVSYRFSLVYTNPKFYKNQLKLKYYTENIKTIQRSVPLKSFDSKYLENIKTITELQIIKSDPIYIENINLLFYISDLTLFNHPKKVQEYYTELTYSTNDCLYILSCLSNKLLEQSMREQSASIYLNIYSKLNYYKIVNVSHSEIDFQIQTFIKEAKYIETEGEMLKYHSIIFPLMYNYMYQTYLYSITDFSDCRLGKLKNNSLIYRFTDISNLEIYYSSIYENKYISKIEKNRVYLQLYDSLRMTEHNEKFPKSNINNYLNYERINQTEEIIPLDIKSEPIVLLLLKMIENDDFRLAKIFLTMNLATKTISFIRTLILLSLLDILGSDNERTYLLDLDLNTKKVIKDINNYNILDYKIDNEYLNEFYNLINLNYASDSKKDPNPWSSFHPRLSFKQQTIDTFFSHKGYISDNLKISETVKITINSFYKKKKKSN